jgi:hypothetical protein
VCYFRGSNRHERGHTDLHTYIRIYVYDL